MKRMLLLAIVVAACGWLIPRGARAQTAATPAVIAAAETQIPLHRVIAYYFYTTKRCVSCRKIEAFTKEAIDTGFPQDLQDGRLVWRLVNIEEKGNEHFSKDYELFTKSVVLVEEADSTQVRWKNLPKIWELLGDQKKFTSYIQDETRAYLAGKP